MMLEPTGTITLAGSWRNVSLAQRFRESAMVTDNPAMPTAQLSKWMADRCLVQGFEVTPIPLRDLKRWSFDPATGNLAHETGKFFTIEGIEVRTNFGTVPRWYQPIMNQPEIGILGILVKEFDGVLHFLMQAKAEPGNVGVVQLSPTVQATRSNYTRVHGGATQPYLEYFLDEVPNRTLIDQLQSEHGARFARKRNRNMIVEALGPVEVGEDFCWLTLGQILALLWQDNVVNMDSRTVLSHVPLGEGTGGGSWGTGLPGDGWTDAMARSFLAPPDHDDEVLNWISALKTKYELHSALVPLRDLPGWRWNDEAIRHVDDVHFEVIGVSVQAGRREVTSWTQPIVRPRETGILAFLARSRGGTLEFLVQGMVEAGNLDILELAPTVQCQFGRFLGGPPEQRPPFLDMVLDAPAGRIIYDAHQSEEGGRFYHEQHRHLVVQAPDEDLILPPNYRWMTARQLKTLVRHSNQLNVQARSLLTCFGAVAVGRGPGES